MIKTLLILLLFLLNSMFLLAQNNEDKYFVGKSEVIDKSVLINELLLVISSLFYVLSVLSLRLKHLIVHDLQLTINIFRQLLECWYWFV